MLNDLGIKTKHSVTVGWESGFFGSAEAGPQRNYKEGRSVCAVTSQVLMGASRAGTVP